MFGCVRHPYVYVGSGRVRLCQTHAVALLGGLLKTEEATGSSTEAQRIENHFPGAGSTGKGPPLQSLLPATVAC